MGLQKAYSRASGTDFPEAYHKIIKICTDKLQGKVKLSVATYKDKEFADAGNPYDHSSNHTTTEDAFNAEFVDATKTMSALDASLQAGYECLKDKSKLEIIAVGQEDDCYYDAEDILED